MIERNDVLWAQRVIDRWAIKKAVPTPMVTTIATGDEIPLSGYLDSTIIVNGKAWNKNDILGKLLLLADAFSYHVQHVSGVAPDDEKASQLACELVLLEIELLADARGTNMTRVMNTKRIADLDASLGGAAHMKRTGVPRFWRRS